MKAEYISVLKGQNDAVGRSVHQKDASPGQDGLHGSAFDTYNVNNEKSDNNRGGEGRQDPENKRSPGVVFGLMFRFRYELR
jgi:hypothetical protein